MSYSLLNGQEFFQKAKGKYDNCGSKEKAAEYYKTNRDVIKLKARKKCRNLSEKKKKKKDNIPRIVIKK